MDYWMRYGIAMHAANSFVDRRIRPAMEKNGIRRSYGPVLLFVKMNPGCSLKDIAEMMHADKALITRLSSSLISEGFAQNTSGKPRVYSLELTPKGLDALGIIEREQTEAWKLLTSDITPEERRAIDSAVEKIAAAAERLGGGNCG